MPHNFIFIGRSGCGKGTQAELLIKHLKENTSEEVFYLGSGQFFRNFFKKDTYTSTLAREISENGGLQPEFLSVWIWANAMIENLKAGNHLVIDGTPRKIREVQLLDSAFDFYNRQNPIVIHVNISRDEAVKRLKKRGRDDDKDEKDINERLDWFETEVVPVINYFKNNPKYTVYEVDGEKTIEEIHQDIISKVF